MYCVAQAGPGKVCQARQESLQCRCSSFSLTCSDQVFEAVKGERGRLLGREGQEGEGKLFVFVFVSCFTFIFFIALILVRVCFPFGYVEIPFLITID